MKNFSLFLSYAYGTKIDLALKMVKVSQGSRIIYTLSYYRPWCYMQSFKETGPVILDKKIFFFLKKFWAFLSMAAILVMWPGSFI